MTPPLRIFLGAIVLMAAATIIGIVHNAVRDNPMPLIPKPKAEGQPSAHISDSSGTALMSLAKVKALANSPDAFIIDARSEEEYNEGHIPGALNVPHDRFVEFYDYVSETIPMDATVVCYCRSVTCDFSDHLAKELRILGYERVFIFREGWEAWVEAKHAIERN
ncbi:MAG: rhodanese-like domain-containing protein [Candidatus Latescibacterota bacterium]